MQFDSAALEKDGYAPHVPELRDRLAAEMFVNLRFAMAGLIVALTLYYAMLVADSGWVRYLPWMLLHGFFNLGILFYHWTAEKWLHDTRKRVRISLATALCNGVLLGLGFLVHFPGIQNPKMQMAIVALVVGVAGAGAITLACHRFFFVIFTCPWLLPLSIYLVFFTRELGYIILGAMSIPYLSLLTFLCQKDFERRLNLIRADIHLREERNEIAANLQLVQQLKSQQDHDYYLTSQLIKPFAVNTAMPDSRLQIEFFTKQKKEFEFRNEKLAIGGDLSMAHNLNFPGRKMTIIVNADAMGKSIQGAGGCLVFGAVFRAIVDRVSVQEQAEPEEWLRQMVIELQKIFETFDCSMLVSAFFFLIDNATGEFYSISAEHPRAVIFRAGRASFLPMQHRLLKLGMPEFDAQFKINRGRLGVGDALIIGSDGRDDLLQENLTSGGSRIDTDAEKFLRTVERGAGEPVKIAREITDSGEISDDLSLVRVAYRPGKRSETVSAATALRNARDLAKAGNRDEAENLLAQLSEILLGRSAALAGLKLALQIHVFSLAAVFAEKLAELGCDDTHALYWSAHAHFYVGQKERALDELRRALPHDPQPRIRPLPLADAAA